MMSGSELRLTFRRLRASSGFSAAVIVTLSLGIGATTALFSLLSAVVLRPLAYRDPDRLVVVWTDQLQRQLHQARVPHPVYREWQEHSSSFADLGFSSGNLPVTLTGVADPQRLDAARASSSMFAALGAAPLEGRTFTAEEDRRKEPVVVLGQALAERRYGSARNALGHTLELDGKSVTVVGVLPRWFQFPSPDVQLWQPLGTDRLRVVVIGRLKPRVTLEKAQTDLDRLGLGLAEKYPDLAGDPDFPGFRTNLVPLTEYVTGRDTRLALWVLLGAVLFVLALACVNAANLLVARVSARQRELALRTALGARRIDLIGDVLREALGLTVVAAALGVALAGWFVRVLVALAPTSVPRLEQVSMDGHVVFFTISVSLICALVFGGVPAWQVLHQQPGEGLKEGGRGTGAGPGRRRVQRALVVLEVALTFLLVCGAGLLLRSLAEVERAPLGFEAHNVLILRMVVPDGMSEPSRGAFYREVVERVRVLPGVSRVGIISNVLTTSTPNATVRIEGRPGGLRVQVPIADDSASPDLFSALHTRLRSGRFFSDDDTAQSPLVAIVNDSFARVFWSGQRPVGRRFQFLDGRFEDRWVTVVGVVGDMRRNGLEHDPFPQVFVPFAQSPSRGADAVILMNTPPLALAASIRQAIAAINPNVPVYRISTLEQRMDAFLTARRFQVLLLSCFAAAALLLAAVGIYGLMRYMVVQRTAEIAVRVAMGATRSRVIGLVLREALVLTSAGLLIGALLALAVTRSVHTLLYGVTPGDHVTLVLAPGVLVIVAIVASVEPAWRAMRIDPMSSLRAG